MWARALYYTQRAAAQWRPLTHGRLTVMSIWVVKVLHVCMDTLEVNTRTTRVSTTHKTVNTPRPKGKGRKAKGSDGALTLGSRLGCRVTP